MERFAVPEPLQCRIDRAFHASACRVFAPQIACLTALMRSPVNVFKRWCATQSIGMRLDAVRISANVTGEFGIVTGCV